MLETPLALLVSFLSHFCAVTLVIANKAFDPLLSELHYFYCSQPF